MCGGFQVEVLWFRGLGMGLKSKDEPGTLLNLVPS